MQTGFGHNCPLAGHILPQIHYVVLMISSVQVNITWINKQEGKQDDEDLNRIFASVHKVSIKHVGLLQRWHAIL